MVHGGTSLPVAGHTNTPGRGVGAYLLIHRRARRSRMNIVSITLVCLANAANVLSIMWHTSHLEYA
jgi:hypothetical protein